MKPVKRNSKKDEGGCRGGLPGTSATLSYSNSEEVGPYCGAGELEMWWQDRRRMP